MQKIYAVYATVELVKPAAWLNEFQLKYDRKHPLHITLKQLAYVKQSDFTKIQITLESIVSKHNLTPNDLQVRFDNLLPCEQDVDDGKGYIYVVAKLRNSKLDDLQRAIREQLASYSSYYFRDSYDYEHEFNPHITIASGLQSAPYASAMRELAGRSISFTGMVSNVTMSLVDHVTLSEANDPNNLTVYTFPTA